MHQTRPETTSKLPIPRKGTKYVARATSYHRDSVPVVIALRDMLKLARTAQEVKEMIKQKSLKVNGRIVYDLRESIKLFNTLHADKDYRLTLSANGKFAFEETKDAGMRICKVTGKHLVSDGKIQLSMHDGTTTLSKDVVAVGDTLYIGDDGKIKKHVALAKGKQVAVISGKYAGNKGSIEGVVGNKVTISVNGKSAALENRSVVAL